MPVACTVRAQRLRSLHGDDDSRDARRCVSEVIEARPYPPPEIPASRGPARGTSPGELRPLSTPATRMRFRPHFTSY